MSKTLLVFGHGYSAFALSNLLLPLGWRVIGTTRKVEEATALRAAGIEALIWPGEDLRAALNAASHILISIPPGAAGDPVLTTLGPKIGEIASKLAWFGYLSTTAVYGDHRGGWVEEKTPLNPATQRGQWRVEAEAGWQSLSATSALPLHIFRLAGIYGPGRGPFSKVRNGTARRIIKENQLFSRIHVEDIAQVLLASMNRPKPGAVYNLCDNEAAPPEDVIAYAATLLQMPVPKPEPFASADLTPMARSFYSESKRVSNHQIKSELGVVLRYPSYREGLTALLEGENSK